MNNIAIVETIAKRVAAGDRDFGRVKATEEGEYVLLNYRRDAMYGDLFTGVEMACRGLVIRTDGKIMCLPFPRMFNLGEPQCPALPDEPYTVWEKVDGSLILAWLGGGVWRCNTRGSFDNEYIGAATSHWDAMLRNGPVSLREEILGCHELSPDVTVMCEICIDNDPMPRAVPHPPGLYLLAVRNRITGEDIPLWDIQTSLPKAKQVYASIDELVGLRETDEGNEGWVIRFEGGLRVKIKTRWYLRLFRAIASMTPKRIRELMLSNDDWLQEFPDDLRPDAQAIGSRIEDACDELVSAVQSAYAGISHLSLCKDFAQAVLADYPEISSWLFLMRDGQFEERKVLEKLDLTRCS